jgi:prepilin-type N-terminal cleavage/methylation domain-containing protein
MKGRGFSLIEVLVAMSLTIILLVGTAELIVLSVMAGRKGDTTAALTEALAARAEGLKSLAYGAGGLLPGAYSETVMDGAGRGPILHKWTVEDAGARMSRVRIRVSLAGRSGAAASLTLWISKDLGFAP